MHKLILLMMVFSLSAYGQRVRENIKQQSIQGVEDGGVKVKPKPKPVKGRTHHGR